jgi:2OG-Fe(II) oxygenase superfamily
MPTVPCRAEPHFDYFHDSVNAQNGGQRLATMLMYLSDVEEGGETVFPSSKEKPVGQGSLRLVLPTCFV